MIRRPRTRPLAVTLLVVALLTLALLTAGAAPVAAADRGSGGSGGSGGRGGGGGGSGDVRRTDVQRTEFHVTLTSQQTVLHELGADGEITYGWNQLTGTATSDSGDIAVELLGNVDYVDGQGPFFGFVTLRFASLAEVGFRVQGDAAKDSSGTTNFTAKMKVLGGSGSEIGVKGGGTITGTRAAALGSPVELDFEITLKGVDIG